MMENVEFTAKTRLGMLKVKGLGCISMTKLYVKFCVYLEYFSEISSQY